MLALGLLGMSLSGCVSVPASFNTYRENFASVKSNALDLYLRSSNIADDIANRPDQESSITDRIKVLETRKTALNLRLEAIALIDRYNSVLIKLGEGSSADALKTEISGLQQGLSSFNLASVSKMLEKGGPYLNVVAQGVSLIEDAVKKRKFKNAVDAAQKPMIGILDILSADADDLEDVLVQELKLQQDPYRVQVDSLGGRFYTRMKTFKPTSDMESLLSRLNTARQGMGRNNYKPLTYQPAEVAVEPKPADVDALTALVGQVEISAVAYSKIQMQINAQREVIQDYKNALDATKKCFVAIAGDVEATRVVATADFVRQATEMRKAVLRLQEAR
jgi:hypothetical protein